MTPVRAVNTRRDDIKEVSSSYYNIAGRKQKGKYVKNNPTLEK